jgi:tetratricopeptide (TPR) repeat protein
MRKMAKIMLIAIAAVVMCGCGSSRSDRASEVVNPEEKNFYQLSDLDVVDPQEIDLVENMATLRTQYYEALRELNRYYSLKGNYNKTQWSLREIEGFNNAPQYTYISPAQIVDVTPGAQRAIPKATELFYEAARIHDRATQFVVVKDKDGMRHALSKYNQVIANYPESDMIDDAAYEAGTIYEEFKEYDIALFYFEKALEWNPQIESPARFHIAYLLDRKFGLKNEALPYYQDAVELESSYRQNYEFALKRIEELTYDQRRRGAERDLK